MKKLFVALVFVGGSMFSCEEKSTADKLKEAGEAAVEDVQEAGEEVIEKTEEVAEEVKEENEESKKGIDKLKDKFQK